jgi:hypothetical protein
LGFPYVCPEPVLVKRSFLHTNGAKMLFPAQGMETTFNQTVAMTGCGSVLWMAPVRNRQRPGFAMPLSDENRSIARTGSAQTKRAPQKLIKNANDVCLTGNTEG